MKGKICIVTGATSGIGKETAIGLARLGAHVVITGREISKTRDCVSELRKVSGNEQIDALAADFTSLSAVRKLADEILNRYPQMDVLVNNAGMFPAPRTLTEDKIEMTFQVNHLSPFLLTNLLLDKLKSSAPSRIVNVASGSHYQGKIDFENLYFEHNYEAMKVYSASKLCNVLFTYELSRRLSGSNVTANCLHPGVVRTQFANKQSRLIYSLGWSMIKPFMISPGQGAETSIYLSSSPEVENMSGRYFDKCKEKRSSWISYDEAISRQLWDVSEALCGLKNK